MDNKDVDYNASADRCIIKSSEARTATKKTPQYHQVI
jgi:hypothetical protein